MGGKVKHGDTKTALYHLWINMKGRCSGNSELHKKYYEGISVCEEWDNDFLVFKTWAVDNGWRIGLEIDRIDYLKGYYPSNCRFVTKKVQQMNRRNVVWLEFNGERKTKADWAKEIGVRVNLLDYRIKMKWPIEKILSPYKQPSNKFTASKNYI